MIELHAVHSSAEHVVGDIGDLSVVADLWKKRDRAAILAAGFSCQPFSTLNKGFPQPFHGPRVL